MSRLIPKDILQQQVLGGLLTSDDSDNILKVSFFKLFKTLFPFLLSFHVSEFAKERRPLPRDNATRQIDVNEWVGGFENDSSDMVC